MNRTTFVAAAAVAVAALIGVPASGATEPLVPEEVTDLLFPESERPDRPTAPQELRMECAGHAEGERAAIGCKWTEAHHQRVAGYRLWRGTSAEDAAVIWEGEENHHVDTTVQPGRTYGYLVEAVAHDGQAVARSRVVWAQAGEGRSTTAQDPSPS